MKIITKIAVLILIAVFSLQTGTLESQEAQTDISEMTAPVQTEMRSFPDGSAWPYVPFKHPLGSDRAIYWTPACYDIE
jgi:hypothetical protein